MALPINPLSDSYDSMSTEQLLDEASKKSQQLSEQYVKDNAGEVEAARILAENQQSAGSWDPVVKPNLELFSAAAKEEYGDDRLSHGNASAIYQSMLSATFSPIKLPANYSPIQQPIFISVDRLTNPLAVSPTTLFEQAKQPGTAKSPDGASPCERNIFEATAAAAGQMAVQAVNNQLDAIRSVAASFEYLKNSVENFIAAVQDLAVQDLIAIIISQEFLLSQIITITEQINKILGTLTEDDYSVIHLSLVRREQIRLGEAMIKLDLLKGELTGGAPFNYELWEDARRDIETTEKDFCGGVEAGVSIKLIKLVGLRIYLALLFRMLARQQRVRDVLEESLLNFKNSIDFDTDFPNLYLPIVEAIRCRLKVILQDMETTAAKNQILLFLIKEKYWCIELKVISAFMKFSAAKGAPDVLNKISITPALAAAESAIHGFLAEQASKIAGGSVQEVLELGYDYIESIDGKLRINVDATGTIALGKELIEAAEAAKANGSILGGLLGAFSGGVAAVASGALAAVGGLMEFADEQNLSSFSDLLKKGKIKEAFGIDKFTASLQGQLGSLTSQISEIAKDNNLSKELKYQLDSTAEGLQDEARNLGLMSKLQTGYAADHIDAKVGSEFPKVVERHKLYQNTADELGENLEWDDPTTIV